MPTAGAKIGIHGFNQGLCMGLQQAYRTLQPIDADLGTDMAFR